MSQFDEATAVDPRGDGRSFDVTVDDAWTIGPGKPNGGYLLALLGRAATQAVATAGGSRCRRPVRCACASGPA